MPTSPIDIIGTSVVTPRGDWLGDIKEVVLDQKNGRIAYSVVAFGGFFSIGNNLFAIPFAAFDFNTTTNQYVLDITKANFQAAPGVHAKWLPASQGERLRLTA